MDFVRTNEEALWDEEEGQVYAIKDKGLIYSTGIPRRDGYEEVWMPIVNALPEDRVEGQHFLLGPAQYEYDPDYDPGVILRIYPEADFSPAAFKRATEARIFNDAEQALAETDWYIIRKMEKGTPIPQEILDAREHIRQAVNSDLDRFDDLHPSEFQEYAPIHVNSARRRARDRAQEARNRSRGRRPDEPPGGRP